MCILGKVWALSHKLTLNLKLARLIKRSWSFSSFFLHFLSWSFRFFLHNWAKAIRTFPVVVGNPNSVLQFEWWEILQCHLWKDEPEKSKKGLKSIFLPKLITWNRQNSHQQSLHGQGEEDYLNFSPVSSKVVSFCAIAPRQTVCSSYHGLQDFGFYCAG